MKLYEMKVVENNNEKNVMVSRVGLSKPAFIDGSVWTEVRNWIYVLSAKSIYENVKTDDEDYYIKRNAIRQYCDVNELNEDFGVFGSLISVCFGHKLETDSVEGFSTLKRSIVEYADRYGMSDNWSEERKQAVVVLRVQCQEYVNFLFQAISPAGYSCKLNSAEFNLFVNNVASIRLSAKKRYHDSTTKDAMYSIAYKGTKSLFTDFMTMVLACSGLQEFRKTVKRKTAMAVNKERLVKDGVKDGGLEPDATSSPIGLKSDAPTAETATAETAKPAKKTTKKSTK